MMIGIAHTLLTENLHDKKFLADYTRGFDQFSDYLLGKPDGVPKTAEWAADICGIPAATLRDLAHRFAANRTLLVGGWAMQRQQHGEQTAVDADHAGLHARPDRPARRRLHPRATISTAAARPPTPAPALGGGIRMATGPRTASRGRPSAAPRSSRARASWTCC